MSQTRRLAAILAADVAGYSRLMGADEGGTLERLKALRRELLDPKTAEHRGRIVKTTGDGMLVEFASVVDAVRCAVAVQRGMIDREPKGTDERRITLRIGINLGDVIADGVDIFGDGVNIAARLEALAEPGGLCISRGWCATRSATSCPTRLRTRASRASRTSRGPSASMRCAPKPLPICRLRACRSPRRCRVLWSRHASRSWCCPSPI
jgi:class 3 adenylate cyclase